ncbi:ADP-ribosylglycohydrolase family protein [Streptomyces sp. NPDC001296]
MDRAAGVLLGAAVGDALGVPYEFKSSLRDDLRPEMTGGGPFAFAPGEYSDDTQMHVCVAVAASAKDADLRGPAALDAIAANFLRWYDSGPADVGNQTRSVLGAARRSAEGSPSEAMLASSRQFTAEHARSAGNGSLMRTGVVTLAHLGDAEAMAEAATLVSSLTHADPDCADACVLWCSGIRTAVLDGTFDGVRTGLELLPKERRDLWSARLDEAEAHPPRHFEATNGWVVAALQAAWSAITRTPVPEQRPKHGSFAAQHFQLALEAAVRTGNDTDTVAAIAGALLGARWGSSAIPLQWQHKVHGWPGYTGADLVRLAVLTARGGADDGIGWPSAPRVRQSGSSGPAYSAAHPHDPGVVLGNLALTQQSDVAFLNVDAVLSLCRVGTAPILGKSGVEHARVWLVDQQGANANLHYTLDQAARQVMRWRQAGKRVLIHCVAGRSRTPAVAALYSCLTQGLAPRTALEDIHSALGGYWTLPHHPGMLDAVHELGNGLTDRGSGDRR